MNFERFTEKARGIVQAAQGLALRMNHQRFTPEHVLSALINDREGLAARLVTNAGGNATALKKSIEAELEKMASVSRRKLPRRAGGD